MFWNQNQMLANINSDGQRRGWGGGGWGGICLEPFVSNTLPPVKTISNLSFS